MNSSRPFRKFYFKAENLLRPVQFLLSIPLGENVHHVFGCVKNTSGQWCIDLSTNFEWALMMTLTCLLLFFFILLLLLLLLLLLQEPLHGHVQEPPESVVLLLGAQYLPLVLHQRVSDGAYDLLTGRRQSVVDEHVQHIQSAHVCCGPEERPPPTPSPPCVYIQTPGNRICTGSCLRQCTQTGAPSAGRMNT